MVVVYVLYNVPLNKHLLGIKPILRIKLKMMNVVTKNERNTQKNSYS